MTPRPLESDTGRKLDSGTKLGYLYAKTKFHKTGSRFAAALFEKYDLRKIETDIPRYL